MQINQLEQISAKLQLRLDDKNREIRELKRKLRHYKGQLGRLESEDDEESDDESEDDEDSLDGNSFKKKKPF